MSYIGNTPTQQNFVAGADQFNGNGSTTAFTLSRNVNTVFDIFVAISNVPQDPYNAYSVSGNTLTFTSAPPSGTGNIYVVYRATNVQTFVPTPGVSASFGDVTYTGTLTGSTGVVNIGSGQVYKDASGNVGIGTSSPASYGGNGKTLQVSAAQYPNVGLSSTASSTNNKNYRWIARDDSAGGPIMQFQTLDDSYGSEQNIWYVSRSTTGITFQSWYTGAAGSNVERMRVDVSGRVTTPYQPCYVGIDRASDLNTGGETNFVTWVHNTTRTNVGGHMNTSTGIFTCPVAGQYLVHFHALCRSNAAHNIEILKNGSMWTRARDIATTGEQASSVDAIVDCAANDNIRISVSNSVGGDYYNTWNGTSIYLLG